MNTVMPAQQRGVGFGGFVFGAFLLILVSILALKVIPAYMEDATIRNVFNSMVHDPDMQNASPNEIRASFDKRADIDRITSIRSGDIEIARDNGKLFLSATYSIKIPLTGNVSLVLDFNPTSAE